MSYSVIWKRAADSHLAAIWIDAEDRDAITRAARELERRLARHPLEEGESRPNGLRIAFELPLAVFYEVHEPHRVVEVVAVWDVPRRE